MAGEPLGVCYNKCACDKQSVDSHIVKDGQSDNWLMNAIVNTFNTLKAEFDGHSATQSEQVKRITNLSFNSFVEDAQIEYIQKMQGSFFDNYADHITSQINISDDLKPTVKGYLEQV
jgi:hypothetical protein